MTSKKLSSSRSIPNLIPQILKIAGLVITLAALFDMLIIPMPYQIGDQQWQIDVITSLVDRGIVPLVGIVLFLTGYGIAGMNGESRSLWQDPRFWACLLASVLGLVYVLAFPLHLYNVGQANKTAIEAVNEQASQAETELNQRIQTEIESRRQQIAQLLTASESQLNQLVQGGQLTQEQSNLVKQFKADPSKVEPFLKKQEADLQSQLKTEIGASRERAQDSRKTQDLKSGLRVGIGSLLLAIGFMTVGWAGLRNLRNI
ncbi:MAG: HpsJ family protein [Elainella sp. Prado103]|jgi:hypothetical protein|nr:HpsJ family protein [Elainella sp. Prado103]